jgi:hypothetical protein
MSHASFTFCFAILFLYLIPTTLKPKERLHFRISYLLTVTIQHRVFIDPIGILSMSTFIYTCDAMFERGVCGIYFWIVNVQNE